MLEVNQIHKGDCLELMSDIPDHSIDMILADWHNRLRLGHYHPH